MQKLTLLSLLLFSNVAFAALNKWVDADGKIHYSDLPPPPNVESQRLRSSTLPSTASANDDSATHSTNAPKSVAEREAELKKAQQEKKEAADKAVKEQANAEALKTYCATARRNLQLLQEDVRIMEMDASGEQSYMDDSRRQQEISRVQQDIAKNCK